MKTLAALALSLLSLTAYNAQADEDRRVRIINNASASIEYLYASNVDRTVWEEDLLGPRRVITPGSYVVANIDDRTGHCLYDLKVVLTDKREAVIRNFNVCTNSSWTVSDGR